MVHIYKNPRIKEIVMENKPMEYFPSQVRLKGARDFYTENIDFAQYFAKKTVETKLKL